MYISVQFEAIINVIRQEDRKCLCVEYIQSWGVSFSAHWINLYEIALINKVVFSWDQVGKDSVFRVETHWPLVSEYASDNFMHIILCIHKGAVLYIFRLWSSKKKAPAIKVDLFMCCVLRWSFSFQWSLDNEEGRVCLKKPIGWS